VSRSEIIADASRALRDTVAQTGQLLSNNAELEALNAGLASVGYALYVRLQVASALESDEFASDKISWQIEATLDLFDDMAEKLAGRISFTQLDMTNSSGRILATFDGAPFPREIWEGFERDPDYPEIGYNPDPDDRPGRDRRPPLPNPVQLYTSGAFRR